MDRWSPTPHPTWCRSCPCAPLRPSRINSVSQWLFALHELYWKLTVGPWKEFGWNSCLFNLFPSVGAEIRMGWSLLSQDLVIMAPPEVTWVLLKCFPNIITPLSHKQATFNQDSHYQRGSFHYGCSFVFGDDFIVWVSKPVLALLEGLWLILCILFLEDNHQDQALG